MIRLYRQLAEHFVLILLFLERNGFRENDIRDFAYRGNYENIIQRGSPTQRIINRTANDPAPEHKEILVDLIRQIDQSVDKKKGMAGDFIDQMVKILQLPWGKQYIDGGHMESLRKAFLLPEEMAGLTSRLRELEFSCYQCKSIFLDGEVTIYKINPKTMTSEIYCTRCVEPRVVRCSEDDCDHKAEISSKLFKDLRKGVSCSRNHEKYRKDKAAAEAVGRDGITEAVQNGELSSSWANFTINGPASDVEAAAPTVTPPRDYIGAETRRIFATAAQQAAAASPFQQAPFTYLDDPFHMTDQDSVMPENPMPTRPGRVYLGVNRLSTAAQPINHPSLPPQVTQEQMDDIRRQADAATAVFHALENDGDVDELEDDDDSDLEEN